MKALPLLPLFVIAAFLPASASAESEKTRIFVPVLPYEWLFERIGGNWIEVDAIVGEGDDAHDYSPSPRQLGQISKANLLFSGELGFEANFFVKVGDGKTAPVALSLLEGLDLLEGSCEACESEHHEHAEHHEHNEEAEAKPAAAKEDHDHHEHDHAHHDHDHGELKDPHVWLSPRMLKQQAERIAVILKEHTSPDASKAIDQNLATLLEELAEIDAELTETLAPLKGQKFYVYHGAFAYFAEAYGLEQKAIEVSGRSPSPKQLAEIAKQAKEDDVHLIFVQPQFDDSSARSLAETIDGTVETLDPLEKDVIANLRTIAAAIRSSRS